MFYDDLPHVPIKTVIFHCLIPRYLSKTYYKIALLGMGGLEYQECNEMSSVMDQAQMDAVGEFLG